MPRPFKKLFETKERCMRTEAKKSCLRLTALWKNEQREGGVSGMASVRHTFPPARYFFAQSCRSREQYVVLYTVYNKYIGIPAVNSCKPNTFHASRRKRKEEG